MMSTLVIVSSNWINVLGGKYYGFPQWKFLERFHRFFDNVYFLSPCVKITELRENESLGIELNHKSVKIIELPFFEGTVSQLRKLYLIRILIPIYFKFIKKADIVFIFNRDLFSTLALIISKIFNKKTVLFVGDIWKESTRKKYKNNSSIFLLGLKLLTFVQKLALRFNNCNSVILATLNKFIEDEVKSFGIDYFTYFASLISEDDIFYKSIAPLNRQSFVNILYVGWLIEAKGVQDLIKAVAQCQKRISKELRLHIIGDGPYKEKLVNLVKQENVWAKFYGFIGNREKLKGVYRECDIFILPSYAEGYPKVVFEAASQGNLVIASDIVELKNICVTYKTKHIDALSSLLEKAIVDFDFYKNQIESQYKYIKNYTIEKGCENIYRIIKERWV